METFPKTNRVTRGGNCYNSGSEKAAFSFYTYYPTTSLGSVGFRPVLYL